MTGYEVALILGMAALTFGIRYVPLALLERFALPPAIERALAYVPPVVLTAIIVPAVLFPEPAVGLPAALVGAAAAVLVSWRTKNLLLTIGVGMAALWLTLALT